MISLPKILLTVAVIGLVWLFYKRTAGVKARLRAGGRPEKGEGRKEGSEESSNPEIKDLVQCKVCEIFVPAKGAARCDRSDCPY